MLPPSSCQILSLIQGLQKYAAGQPQPWGKFPEPLEPGRQQQQQQQRHSEAYQHHPQQGDQNAPAPAAYFVSSADDRAPGVSIAEGNAGDRWGGWGTTWNGASTGHDAGHGGAAFGGGSSRSADNNGWGTAEGVREKGGDRRSSSGSMDMGDTL